MTRTSPLRDIGILLIWTQLITSVIVSIGTVVAVSDFEVVGGVFLISLFTSPLILLYLLGFCWKESRSLAELCYWNSLAGLSIIALVWHFSIASSHSEGAPMAEFMGKVLFFGAITAWIVLRFLTRQQ